LVERRRLLSRAGTRLGASRTLPIAVTVLGAGDEEERGAHPQAGIPVEAGNPVAPHLIPLAADDLEFGERSTPASLRSKLRHLGG
jgi:hypothetical protein